MDGVGLAGELRGERVQAAKAEPVGLEETGLVGPGAREDLGQDREGAVEEREVLLCKRPD